MPDQYMLNFGGAALSFGGGSCGWEDPAPPSTLPYLLLQCDGYGTGHPDVSSDWNGGTCVWTNISASPNIWKLEITRWGIVNNLGWGLLFLFGSNDTSSSGTIRNNCRLIGSGNLDVALDGRYCQSMDRMFSGCTGLTYIEQPIQCTRVENVGGMFQGCINVNEGALAQYNWFNTYGENITNHSGTFTDCGRDTVTGAAELAQIPVGWGGTLVPPSTLMTSSRTKWFNNYDTWVISGSTPTWTSINGMFLFTESSVSAYAGVSMNRTRIRAFNGLGTSTGNALYFYPCIFQHTPTTSGTITWAVVTASYNDMLTSSQSNTDMAGTLDYNTYGAFSHEYGTYDSSKDVCFGFLVLNVTVDNWNGLTDKYGLLFNAYFKPDGGFRYFF